MKMNFMVIVACAITMLMVGCTGNGKTATVRYTQHFNSGSNKKDKFTLQKMEDGTWKVWK